MRRKLLMMTVSTIAALLFSMVIPEAGAQVNPGSNSASKADKINMVKRACANGALTKEECAAKLAALQGGGSAQRNSSAPGKTSAENSLAGNNTSARGNGSTAGGSGGSAAAGSSQVIMSNSPEPPPASGPKVEERMPRQSGQPASYRDPQGRFSFMVPAGWKMKLQGKNGEDGVMISNGTSWAMIGPYGGVHDTIDLVESLASQYQAGYQDYSMGDHGSLQVNGHDAAYAAFSGVNSKGENVGMRYGGVSAGHGHFLGVAVFIPHNEIPDTDPQIKDLFMSISFGQ